jgi:hypothetical protein
LTHLWQPGHAQLRKSDMFIATVPSHDSSQPHRGGMDCPTQPCAALTGLGNILMDIVGYKHGTPTGFGISRCARRRPTQRITDLRLLMSLASNLAETLLRPGRFMGSVLFAFRGFVDYQEFANTVHGKKCPASVKCIAPNRISELMLAAWLP